MQAENVVLENIRLFLSATVDPEIEINQERFREAMNEIFDNHQASINSEKYLFDEIFYMSARGSIRLGVTPLRDYFETGCYLGISPHPLVQPEYIRHQLVDLTSNQTKPDEINPLLILLCGRDTLVSPNIFFQNDIYMQYAESVVAYNKSIESVSSNPPIKHYLQNWRDMQKIRPLAISDFFDPQFYSLQSCRHGYELNDPLTSYLEKPILERDDCNPRFHNMFYRAKYNVKGVDSLQHFITTGAKRTNLPNPFASDELGLEHLTAPPEIIEKVLLEYTRLKKVV